MSGEAGAISGSWVGLRTVKHRIENLNSSLDWKLNRNGKRVGNWLKEILVIQIRRQMQMPIQEPTRL